MKKLIALLLTLALVLTFAACTTGTNDDTTAANDDTTAAIDDTTADDTVEVMSFQEYMAAETDAVVCVDTYVQGHQSWWDNKITVYAQSPDGAYLLYNMACSEEDAEKLVPGTMIRVTGTKAVWEGEIEIADATFEIAEGGDTYIAEAADLTDLLGTDELENHMNEYVAFKGLTVKAIEYKNGEPGDDIYLTLELDGNAYSFCVEYYLTGTDTEVYTTVGTLAEGDVVDVACYLYWYNGANPHITAISLAA